MSCPRTFPRRSSWTSTSSGWTRLCTSATSVSRRAFAPFPPLTRSSASLPTARRKRKLLLPLWKVRPLPKAKKVPKEPRVPRAQKVPRAPKLPKTRRRADREIRAQRGVVPVPRCRRAGQSRGSLRGHPAQRRLHGRGRPCAAPRRPVQEKALSFVSHWERGARRCAPLPSQADHLHERVRTRGARCAAGNRQRPVGPARDLRHPRPAYRAACASSSRALRRGRRGFNRSSNRWARKSS